MATTAKNIEDLERFHIPVGSCTFKSQFTGIYMSRLKAARPILEAKAQEHWIDSPPIRSLAELNLSEECIIIGTLFKVNRLIKLVTIFIKCSNAPRNRV